MSSDSLDNIEIEMQPRTGKSSSSPSFKLEIAHSSMKILTLCLVIVSIIVVLCRAGNMLDVPESAVKNRKWYIAISIQNIINVAIFVIGLYNRYVNNKHLIRLNSNNNNLVFFCMVIPAMILTVIHYSIVFNNVMMAAMKNFKVTVFYFTKILSVTGIVIIVKDIETIDWKRSTQLQQSQTLFHKFTVNVAICEAMFSFVYEMFEKYNGVYQEFAWKQFHIDYNNSIAYNEQFLWMFGSGSSAFHIICLICLITCYSKPNLNLFYKKQSRNIHRILLPKRSIIFSVVMIVIGFIPIPVLFVVKHSSKEEKILLMVLISMGYIIYFIGIMSCKVQLEEVRHWKTFSQADYLYNLTDRSFVWVGFMGQCLSSFAYCLFLVDGLLYRDGVLLHITLYMYVLFHLLEASQSFVQTILIEISINKRWRIARHSESYAGRFCPILLLIAVNCVAFFICLYKNYTSEQFNITTSSGTLLFKYSSALGDVFGNIQRLHAVLYFVQMLLVVYL